MSELHHWLAGRVLLPKCPCVSARRHRPYALRTKSCVMTNGKQRLGDSHNYKENEMMDDLKPLLVFAAVLEHGSMNAAAQALAMTPSAVSQHIARLEHLHGVKLLHRSTRRVSPTEAGATLAQYCRRLSATLRDTRLALDNLKTDIAGEVRLAAPTSMATAPAFQCALQRIGEEHPALRLQLHFGEALADLRSGAIDIALRGGEHALDAPDLVARHLADWRWIICAAPAWLERAPPIVSPADLGKQRWLHHLPLRREMRRGEERFLLDIEDSFIATSSRRCAICARRGWDWR